MCFKFMLERSKARCLVPWAEGKHASVVHEEDIILNYQLLKDYMTYMGDQDVASGSDFKASVACI